MSTLCFSGLNCYKLANEKFDSIPKWIDVDIWQMLWNIRIPGWLGLNDKKNEVLTNRNKKSQEKCQWNSSAHKS